MEAALRDLAEGRGDGRLRVVYSDLHGLWGGVTITLTGDGEYEHTSRQPGGPPVTVRRRVEPGSVRSIVRLLRETRAWEQRIPERAPLPDESRATLAIACGGAESSTWERYNDLQPGQGIGPVRDALARLLDEDSASPAGNFSTDAP